MITTDNLLDSTVAAKLLGLRPRTLAMWRWRGFGPTFVRVGRAIRYEPAAIENFIASRRATSTSDVLTSATAAAR